MKEEITIDGRLCAIILKAEYDKSGIQFFTANELSQQLASMSYKSGKIIPAHTHQPVRREVHYTQETLFIRKGKLRVDFYSTERDYRFSRILRQGDVILLIAGGHGFEVLEELNMVEVKQGPYAGDKDKVVFSAAAQAALKFD
jgi:mannose-6-phosphate isomerase-like protein (cupin superfamily)